MFLHVSQLIFTANCCTESSEQTLRRWEISTSVRCCLAYYCYNITIIKCEFVSITPSLVLKDIHLSCLLFLWGNRTTHNADIPALDSRVFITALQDGHGILTQVSLYRRKWTTENKLNCKYFLLFRYTRSHEMCIRSAAQVTGHTTAFTL